MFNVGDIVTRNSYNNDIIFKISEIKDNECLLCGVNIRLIADSDIDDLKKYNKDVVEEDVFFDIGEYKSLDRNEYFYLPGKILHIDSDEEYLKKCSVFYKKNRVKAYGVLCSENNLETNIRGYLDMYKPDILVITGHDAYYRKRKDNEKYKNTRNFVLAIHEAREYEKSQEKLLIIAGACQSNYEELIKAGANFASSPKRVNIHALDPAIVATSLSFSDKGKDISLIDILNKTKYKTDGMGGIKTKGTMYIGYPRE